MCTTGRPAADAFSLVHITLHPVLKTIIVPWLMPKSVKRNYTNLRLVNLWTCGSTPGHVSQGNTWPIVPESFRRELFNIIHLAHQDTCCLEWPTLRCPLMDTHFFLANSLKFKDTPRPTADIWPSGRVEDNHIDIVGPFPPSHEFSCFLIPALVATLAAPKRSPY